MIHVDTSGSFDKTLRWLHKLQEGDIYRGLETYGRKGVDALAGATPRDSGATADSWYYGIDKTKGGVTIWWGNRNENDGVKIAILIQYGHGTGTGGYVTGTDYINPAIRPIFDQIATDVWKKVTDG
jgi:hypothetical protein